MVGNDEIGHRYHPFLTLVYLLAVGGYLARSTGSQRSSRLLSLGGANAMVLLPAGLGVIEKGGRVTAVFLPYVPRT